MWKAIKRIVELPSVKPTQQDLATWLKEIKFISTISQIFSSLWTLDSVLCCSHWHRKLKDKMVTFYSISHNDVFLAELRWEIWMFQKTRLLSFLPQGPNWHNTRSYIIPKNLYLLTVLDFVLAFYFFSTDFSQPQYWRLFLKTVNF